MIGWFAWTVRRTELAWLLGKNGKGREGMGKLHVGRKVKARDRKGTNRVKVSGFIIDWSA